MAAPEIKIRDAEFQASMGRFLAHSTREVEVAVREVARALVRKCVELTPPCQGKADKDAQRRGEAQIQNDLWKIFMPIENSFVDEFLSRSDVADDFLSDYIGDSSESEVKSRVLVRSQMKDFHDARRGRSGRVVGTRPPPSELAEIFEMFMPRKYDGRQKRAKKSARAKAIATIDLSHDIAIVRGSDFDSYAKEAKTHVGALASGWNKAAAALGYHPPAWILRHGDKFAQLDPPVFNEQGFRIRFANNAPYGESVRGLTSRIQQAMNYQTRDMDRRVAHSIQKAAQRAALRTTG